MQRSFIVINKSFAHAGGVSFKKIQRLFTPWDLALKNTGSLYISARAFGAGISSPVRIDQEQEYRPAESGRYLRYLRMP